jgi:leucyl aminopeptidase (aminopeptidase T)
LRLWSLSNILFDERMGLSFTIAAGPRQRGHSHVRVPRVP